MNCTKIEAKKYARTLFVDFTRATDWSESNDSAVLFEELVECLILDVDVRAFFLIE